MTNGLKRAWKWAETRRHVPPPFSYRRLAARVETWEASAAPLLSVHTPCIKENRKETRNADGRRVPLFISTQLLDSFLVKITGWNNEATWLFFVYFAALDSSGSPGLRPLLSGARGSVVPHLTIFTVDRPPSPYTAFSKDETRYRRCEIPALHLCSSVMQWWSPSPKVYGKLKASFQIRLWRY